MISGPWIHFSPYLLPPSPLFLCSDRTHYSFCFVSLLSNLLSILTSQVPGTCSARVPSYRSLCGSLLPFLWVCVQRESTSLTTMSKIAISHHYSPPSPVYLSSWLLLRPAPNMHKSQGRDANRGPVIIQVFTNYKPNWQAVSKMFSNLLQWQICNHNHQPGYLNLEFSDSFEVCTRKQRGWASGSQTLFHSHLFYLSS